MARTELLNRLQEMYREFDSTDSSNKSTPTRREFLKSAGIIAAAAAIAGPAGLSAAPNPRIVIVGGGIAGLNAALTLNEARFPFTLYEASSRIGGRMHSDTTSWANGQITEHCGELIDSTHKTILGLAKQYKIQVDDLSAAEPRQSSETYYFFGQYYSRSEANDDFNAVYQAVKKDSIAAGFPTLYSSFTSAGLALDNLSVYDWIEIHIPGGHASKMGQLLDVAYTIEYGADTAVQSSLNLIYLLAFQSAPGNFRMFGRSNERYHLHGGNEELPRAIAAALPAGSIQTGVSLTSIAKNNDATYTLGFQRGKVPFTVVADRVIMAIPFSILRNLEFKDAGFNGVKTTAIQQLGYGTNAKLHLQFDEKLWNQTGPWGLSNGTSFADTGYQNTWEVTRAQPGATGILVDYTGGTIGSLFADATNPAAVQVYANQFLSQLKHVFPGIDQQWNGRATLDTPALSPYLLGSYSYWKKGQYTSFAGAEAERSGNCHFAGEHCSINFQGYMEGGAQEGARAATEILSDYKNL